MRVLDVVGSDCCAVGGGEESFGLSSILHWGGQVPTHQVGIRGRCGFFNRW